MALTRLMRPIPLSSVTITDKFWLPWLDRLVRVTLPTQHEKLVETARIKNFQEAARAKAGATDAIFEGTYYNDSDVYKWMEAASLCLQSQPNHPEIQKVRELLEKTVDIVAAAQEDNGYINTFFQINYPDKKWKSLNSMHEMYCGGHLIEAAVAHYAATGSKKLLEVAIKFADHVGSIFGPDKRRGACGHQEFELALIALADATGNNSYRDFARWMIEIRGTKPSFFEEEVNNRAETEFNPAFKTMSDTHRRSFIGEYLQDHAPIREHDRVVGHAVRAMYMYIAATQVCNQMDTENNQVETAILKCWNNLTKQRMYITGGIGPSGKNEGFTEDYDLPNLTAYAETCAAIGLAIWGRNLTEHTGEAEFMETVERALYNGALSGLSLDGKHYFYDNPLESRGTHARSEWFSCACCPPNIARTIAQISRYATSFSNDGFWIHIPIGMEANCQINGEPVKITINSNYPWDGKVEVKLELNKPTKFKLHIRIPEWCEDTNLDSKAEEGESDYDKGYIVIDKVWNPNETVSFELEMSPQYMISNPNVLENLGRVALQYGPVIYALENHELKAAPQRFIVDTEAEPTVQFAPDLLGGVNTIEVSGHLESLPEDEFAGQLYTAEFSSNYTEKTAKLIPYYAWNNRGKSHMQVWLRS